jgi:hypothetical protein
MLASLLLQGACTQTQLSQLCADCNHAAAIAPAQKRWRSMLVLQVDREYKLLIKAYNRI